MRDCFEKHGGPSQKARDWRSAAYETRFEARRRVNQQQKCRLRLVVRGCCWTCLMFSLQTEQGAT